jgi:SAM-dependent methyltransferase
MATERRGLRRVAAVGLWGLAAAQLVPLSGSPPLAAELGSFPPAEVVRRTGVAVDDGARVAAAREMASGGLTVIDLVPAELPVERAMALLRRVVHRRFADEWLYTPGGAHEALALDPSLADSARIGLSSPLDAGALARVTVRAQRHASRAAGVRVTDLVRADDLSPADRWREAEQLTAFAKPVFALAPVMVAARTCHLLAMTAGTVVAPAAGVAAAVTWLGQPALVFGGPRRRRGPLRPPNLVRAGALRLVRSWANNVLTAMAGVEATCRRPPTAQTSTPRRAELFDDPVTRCPWCGSSALAGRLDTSDVMRRVPGTIHLDECASCGHIFQNPALSDVGLDHYYRDLYDGEGDEGANAVFAAMAPLYRRRCETISQSTTPGSLLDVGTGHGHFCLVARQRWPDALVDGLDQSESVDEAYRRGWVEHAYRGVFPDLADGLPRSYDVITMSHYLEHTRAPRRELAAAAKVLEPGGFLMVEVPDPESPWARRLGPYWGQWVQPQHLHFVSCANLMGALRDEGFDIVSVDRAAAHIGGNLLLGLGQAVERLAPSPHHPWCPRPPAGTRVRRIAVLAAAAPLAAVSAATDAVMDGVLRRRGGTRPGDAFRVVARRL